MVWDWLKFQIKGFVMKYSKELYSREKRAINDLNKELQELTAKMDQGDQSGHVADLLESVRRDLKQREDIRANKLIFRSRSRWAQLGEKPSGYFLNLQKRQSKDRTLSTVSLPENGVVTNNPKEILQACSTFYAKLYTQESTNLAPTQDILDNIDHLVHPRLSDQARALLDAEPTVEELKKALKQLNSNKSPGTDGLPRNFTYSSGNSCLHFL